MIPHSHLNMTLTLVVDNSNKEESYIFGEALPIEEVVEVEETEEVVEEQDLTNVHVFKPWGELEYCDKCGGLEGGLPTDCPDANMSAELQDKVYAGNLDFRKGEGWVNKLSPMGQSMCQSRIFDMFRQREGCYKSDNEIILALGTTKEEYMKVKKYCLEYIYGSRK